MIYPNYNEDIKCKAYIIWQVKKRLGVIDADDCIKNWFEAKEQIDKDYYKFMKCSKEIS